MRIKILLADDHAVFRSGLKALLENEEDLEVVAETGSGIETIRAVCESAIDVLLLDISLPDLSGPKVAEEVLRKQSSVGIIVLTMHEDEYYLQEMLKIGVRGYVLKRSTGTDVIHAIRAVHAGKEYVDPSLASCVISRYVGRQPKRQTSQRLAQLTQREQEVCSLLAFGHTNHEIAQKLAISVRTVETHRAHLLAKLNLTSRAELVRFAIDNGLLRLS